MSEETKTHEPEKEATPEWATNLQKTMEDLTSRLSEALNPQQPEETSNEIPVPQPPQPPQPEPTTETEPEPPQPEPKKKRKLLDWLL
ncbi:MAG: hypothetical protein IJW78_04850 [Clostridia bacterium]|nr:hypothetical protein [Clostridia bacterium]